ncbi:MULTISPECIES: hypothetical protein [Blastopirellula]|uniref:Secreted protein n=1 Tax=Blastopirellula marina DSM 3645 TaxID=314230 RepID=A3ZTX1_9BACT|nr:MULTISPECIES: hypothetical protein [Blastopirellula]EAQ80029.1 hypothetical protein DSM3645_05385 [Blastopirellula marina DSM 3645]UUO05280.1 hypothetical protein M4951_18090 [Blastopirellula sp. J2-11]
MVKRQAWMKAALVCGMTVIAAAATGCQIDVGGQTLPSPYYMTDDVQYYPKGPEFILQREADQMQATLAEQAELQGEGY